LRKRGQPTPAAVHSDSVPINMLVQVEGTPLGNTAKLDPLDFVRPVAVART
jgi:biotin synthase